MNPAFDGRWRLSYVVFEPTGGYVGVLHQMRRVVMPDSGNLRSEFTNTGDAAVLAHPISKLVGDWRVEIESGSITPRYLGPDISGESVVLAPSTVCGEGQWPRIGFEFTSMSTLVSAWRQMTGLLYYQGDSRSAIGRLFGIAMPEAELGHAWPELDIATRAADISRYWRGTLHTFDAHGAALHEHPLQRLFTPTGWIDSGPHGEIQQARPYDHGLWLDAQAAAGRAVVYSGIGAAARLVDTKTGAYRADYLEMFDAGSGTLIWLRHWVTPNAGVSYEWAQMKFSPS